MNANRPETSGGNKAALVTKTPGGQEFIGIKELSTRTAVCESAAFGHTSRNYVTDGTSTEKRAADPLGPSTAISVGRIGCVRARNARCTRRRRHPVRWCRVRPRCGERAPAQWVINCPVLRCNRAAVDTAVNAGDAA
jgi:hypothetical protein